MNKFVKSIHTDDYGHIVVETVGAFIPFVLLVVSILSLVNIVAVQSRIHYALTQTANSISMYSYTLEILGVTDDLIQNANQSQTVAGEVGALRAEINRVITGINSLSDIGDAANAGMSGVTRVTGWGEGAMDDPQAALQLLMNYGVNELRSLAFEQLARPLVGRYLAAGDMGGDEYLRRAGIVNRHTGAVGLNALEFYRFMNLGTGNSVLLDSNGNVKLTVEYEVNYIFGTLPLPFRPTIKITQTVVTKAWLNGSGRGYVG